MTCASEVADRPVARGDAGLAERPRQRLHRLARGGLAAGHVDAQERARVDDDARLGPVGLDADRAGDHRVRAEALAQQRRGGRAR